MSTIVDLVVRAASVFRLASVLGVLALAGCAPQETVHDSVPAPAPAPAPAPQPAVARPTPDRPAQPGLVVSDAPLATQVGVDVLEAGGNAMDAAVATAFALAVVYPQAGNLGGGGFLVARFHDDATDAADGFTEVALDFRETAPAAATATMFLDERGGPRPDASRIGPLAAGVPGSPAGYFELHRRFGRLPWPRVVAPAVALARDGFAISWSTARSLAEHRDELGRFPETAAVWLPGGRAPGAGSRLALPALATTLEAYARIGPEAVVAGPVAAAVGAASSRHGGVLTAADLAAYRPEWREPLRFERFGWSFAAMPLPSSGGFLVAESLGLLERLGALAAPPDSGERTHLLLESFRRAFADRFDLGDPATTRRAIANLLAPARLDRLALGVDRARATPSARLRAGDATAEPSETTNLSVVDAEGGAVVITTTLNQLYGCGLWVAEAGFFLNDEMDDFTAAPGRPNLYGLVQGDANLVRAGRRPLSSMAPTLAWRGPELIAIGGRGGSRIPTGIVQVLLRLWDGDAPAAAVARPRLHHQWLPERVELERGGLPDGVRRELEGRGHVFAAPTDVSKLNLVRRRADGTMEAGGDPRGFEAAATVALADGGT
jgi:gamma-glutamyltranspeptidase/glutathione hydrolase